MGSSEPNAEHDIRVGHVTTRNIKLKTGRFQKVMLKTPRCEWTNMNTRQSRSTETDAGLLARDIGRLGCLKQGGSPSLICNL